MKKHIFIIVALIIVLLLGSSYAWFNYRSVSNDQVVIAGNIYMKYNEGVDYVSLPNVYPTKKEEARAQNDNYITFTIKGKNTSVKNIYYDIFLKYGDEKESPFERFNDSDLVFDLVEVGENNEETYLLDAVSYDTINNRRIWIDSIIHNTDEEITRTYKLRVWLSERVMISDTEPNANYTAQNYRYHYASIKLGVSGDFKEKSLPSNAVTRDSYVENGKSYFLTSLTNDYLLEDEGKLLDENDTVILEITNPENKLYFSYVDSRGNENNGNNENLTLTYVYNRNEKVNIKVFTESRDDSNVKTTLHFKVTKNGDIVQEYNKEIDVVGNNFCLNNGFINFKDCILATDNLSKDVSSAKAFINTKGAPDVNSTAPTYTYVEEQTENFTYTGTSGYPNWSSGEKYTFNETTGTFTLKKSDGITNANTSIPLTNNALIGTYTCGTSNSGFTCSTIYKITSVDTVNNKVTGTKITYKIVSSLDSQVGLYKIQDYDGDSYIFRGNVTNNNVLFGGYYWKVVRINGDGSIRLIFNGKTLSSDGNKTAGYASSISTTAATGAGSTYPFNQVPGGPTYVGYMTTDEENYWMTSILTNYANFAEDTAYYFADEFETYTDEWGNRMFKLKGNTYQSKVKDLTQSQIDAKPYTCSGTNANLICSRVVKVDSRVNVTTVKGYYITYSPNYEANTSMTKADAEQNVRDSNAKRQLDLWYQNKLMNNLNNGKMVSTYLADEVFCNDRRIYNPYTNGSYTLNNSYNSGYLLTTHTYYAARTRILDALSPNKMATLSCEKNDAFTVTETPTANGKLTYPIGLITIDEVALAGGKYNEKNENFYLRTNGYYWTMSPSNFYSSLAYASEWYVYPAGLLYSSNYFVSSGNGLRAVINLKSDSLLLMGDGTVSNPYQIK